MDPSEKERDDRVRRLQARLPSLSDALLEWIESTLLAFAKDRTFWRDERSTLVDERFLAAFGDTLRLHHVFSSEPFSKDKFEYAMVRMCQKCGRVATLAPKGNPGHDATIDGVPFSLKTQANKGIQLTELHISKFMELGKGKWGTDPDELIGLREQFLKHMKGYERIIVLRCLCNSEEERRYELVEIPKKLLQRAISGDLEMMTTSKQLPRPGYCRVRDRAGNLLFELYFDGGTERKLQVRHLAKEECFVHAAWRFS